MDQIPGGGAEAELEVSLIVKEYSLEFTCKALGFFFLFSHATLNIPHWKYTYKLLVRKLNLKMSEEYP